MTLDREMVDSRISEPEPGIFVVRELRGGTSETWAQISNRVIELTASRDRWAMIIDLGEVQARPKGEYREAITVTLKNMSALHIAMVQPGNVLLRSVLRFIMSNITERSSVHKDVDSALEKTRGILAIAVGG